MFLQRPSVVKTINRSVYSLQGTDPEDEDGSSRRDTETLGGTISRKEKVIFIKYKHRRIERIERRTVIFKVPGLWPKVKHDKKVESQIRPSQRKILKLIGHLE